MTFTERPRRPGHVSTQRAMFFFSFSLDSCDTTCLVNSQYSITAVEDSPLNESSAHIYNQVRQELFIAQETTQNMAEISVNTPARVIEHVAPADVASYAASASSSAPTPARAVLDGWITHISFDGETPAERMMLRREAQEASADQAAAELFAGNSSHQKRQRRANTRSELWTVYEMAPPGVRGGIQVLDT